MAVKDPCRHNLRGALLVEALVSFMIFLVASIAFLGLMANSRRAETKATQMLFANSYARQLMEGQRAKSYSALKLGTVTGVKDFGVERGGVAGKTRMTHTITVTSGPETGAKSIVVSVSWNQGRVSLESYVTE
jgi:Tfp pilus assembly protein PilV